ncbi:hypothetical protein [Amycolatopsis suaedae]|uniref:Uncharacterized protein n=1 Tax=Amycolatopsis suaedae TaxID=2510978 RepID=A0A4Q7J403_9PSEU|nr:hypothetical protein [Amycolatopsis suaedae]RZQ61362.1 hypothetical protein EWH70_23490 [Amycolatopsis suaedae]
MDGLDDARRHPWEDWPPVDRPGPVVRGVVSLAGRTLTLYDSECQLISLELWSTMLVLNLTLPVRSLREHRQPWTAWDDQGTQYAGGANAGAGSPELFVARVTFSPGPPAGARRITLAVEGRTLAVDLPGPGS